MSKDISKEFKDFEEQKEIEKEQTEEQKNIEEELVIEKEESKEDFIDKSVQISEKLRKDLDIFQKKLIKPNFSDVIVNPDIPTIKTGLTLYDEIIGGVPLSSIVSLRAEPGVGKTTLMVQLLAAIQKQDVTVLYIDTEGSMSRRRMASLGLNIDGVIYTQPESLEQSYKLIYNFIDFKNKNFGEEYPVVIAWDSVSMTPAQAEVTGGVDDKSVGLRARVNTKYLPQVNNFLKKYNTTLILINQLRNKIGGMATSWTGPEKDIPGGEILKYAPSQNINLRDGSVNDVKNKLGYSGKIVKVKAIKNRIADPLREFPMVFTFEYGFVEDLSLFYLVSTATKDQWKKTPFETPQIKSGAYWNLFDPEDPDNPIKFRQKDFRKLYNENERFKELINLYAKELIKTI